MPDPADAPHTPFPPDPGFRGARAAPADAPRPPRPRDPGSRRGAIVAWIVAVIAFAIVAGIQNFAKAPPPESPDDAPVRVEDTSQFTMIGKVFLRVDHWAKPIDPGASGQFASSLPMLADTAANDADRLAVAVVTAELLGDDAALDRLDALADELPDDTPLRPVLDDLRTIYAGGAPPPDRWPEVEDTLGFFGRVALSRVEGSGFDRDHLLAGGAGAMGFILGVVLFFLLVGLASFVCFVLAIVRLASRRGRRPAFVPPTPGGSVFLETFALLVCAFLLMIVTSSIIQPHMPKSGVPISFILQWTLLAVPFWPLLRGVRFAEWRRLVGLHAGKGLLREAGAGVFCYLASLPIYLGAMVLSFLLITLWWSIQGAFGREPPPPQNEILEIVSSGNLATVILLFMLATVWAPFVEETVFRGSLFRHLRSRLGFAGAGIASACFFAFMHGYGPLLAPPLITLGLVFAFMREWRGTIVPSIVAHWLHNATLLTISICAVRIFTA